MNSFQTKYKVLNKIGEGSFSEVLKCENRITGVRYAAKRLRKVYRTEENVKFCAEIVAAKRIPYHPNIVNMLEYHYDSGALKLIFIFELMDMSMYDFLKIKTKPPAEIRIKNYLYQILKGLGHLHKHGLFHRDVKPENVLIRLPSLLNSPLGHASCEIIKIADLGSVRGIYSVPPYTEYISTRWYRSPECLLTIGHYGPKMDIWALGCVFYEMLTLKPLFPGANEIDQLYRIHQIMGPPNLQMLSKLKTKSKNCISFPKIKGTGIDLLLPNVSEKGKSVLKLMIEYDPDKRSNVRRLLRNKYFDDLKSSQHWEGRRMSPYRSEGSYSKNLDAWSGQNKIKNESTKREHYSDEPRKSSLNRRRSSEKDSSQRRGSKDSSGSNKSTKSTNSNKSNKSGASLKIPPINKQNKLEALPLVNYKLLKVIPTKKNIDQSFSKTTSNLQSTKKPFYSEDIQKKAQFQSKSFIHSCKLLNINVDSLLKKSVDESKKNYANKKTIRPNKKN